MSSKNCVLREGVLRVIGCVEPNFEFDARGVLSRVRFLRRVLLSPLEHLKKMGQTRTPYFPVVDRNSPRIVVFSTRLNQGYDNDLQENPAIKEIYSVIQQ